MNINMDANLRAVQDWFASVEAELSPAMDEAVHAALDDLIQALRPVTPVRTGRMQASYTIATGGPDEWLLVNTAESPRGYSYPTRVLDDPTWSRGYGPLNDVLDAGIDQIERDLDVALDKLIGRPL
jgi:hypothetical protein